MRMSFSRFAAIGASLVAGVTLASCASSSAPIPGTGPNSQSLSFAGNNIGVLQGSPNLNLGITVVDFYIDGNLAAPGLGWTGGLPFFLSIPAGAHDFKFVQAGSLAPVFADQVFTTKAGTKYLVIAQGDAAVHSTDVGFYQIPHYNTSNGAAAFSFFNASPRAGPVDVYYNCFNCATATLWASNVIVGSHASPTASWKNNVLALLSGQYCFSAYAHGTTTPAIASVPTGADAFTDTGCAAGLNLISGPVDLDFGIVDNLTPPGGTFMGFFTDQNG
jgi:hypothetical protein